MLTLLDRLIIAYFDWRGRSAAKHAAEETGIDFVNAQITPEHWHLELRGSKLMFLLEEAASWLDKTKADNYLQFDMIPRAARTDWRAVRVTLQWTHGESPAEQNARLRDENASLRTENAALRQAMALLNQEEP